MKSSFSVCVVGLCGALVSGGLSGCVAPEGSRSTTVVQASDGKPLEVQPKPRPRTRSKQGANAEAITIAKVVPTPSPSAKTKGALKTRSKGAPTGTNIPYYFTIDPGFWPSGVTSVNATAKCYQITSLSNGTTPAVTLASTTLSVFPGSSSSKTMTLTPGATNQVNLNFPASTAGMTVIVIVNGTGYDDNGDLFNFSGGDILVVNP